MLGSEKFTIAFIPTNIHYYTCKWKACSHLYSDIQMPNIQVSALADGTMYVKGFDTFSLIVDLHRGCHSRHRGGRWGWTSIPIGLEMQADLITLQGIRKDTTLRYIWQLFIFISNIWKASGLRHSCRKFTTCPMPTKPWKGVSPTLPILQGLWNIAWLVLYASFYDWNQNLLRLTDIKRHSFENGHNMCQQL